MKFCIFVISILIAAPAAAQDMNPYSRANCAVFTAFSADSSLTKSDAAAYFQGVADTVVMAGVPIESFVSTYQAICEENSGLNVRTALIRALQKVLSQTN